MVAVMLDETGACVQRAGRLIAHCYLEVQADGTLRGRGSGQGGGDRGTQAGAPVARMNLDCYSMTLGWSISHSQVPSS